MIRILIILTILILTNTTFSQTQSDANQESYNDYQQADKKLNEVYQEILKRYSENKLFIEKLKIAQRLWIQLRDAQLDMKFPSERRDIKYYGSVLPMCISEYLGVLTNARIEELEEWLKGCEEGYVCRGTIGQFEELKLESEN